MLKNGIILGFIVFILMIIRQAIFSNQINWFDVIGLSVTVIIASMFVEWARKPYKYKNNQDD